MKRNVDLLPDKIGVAAGNIRGLFQPREETSANESSGQQTNCLSRFRSPQQLMCDPSDSMRVVQQAGEIRTDCRFAVVAGDGEHR